MRPNLRAYASPAAFLACLVLSAAAAPARADEAGDRRAECDRLTNLSIAAGKKVTELSDEVIINQQVLKRPERPDDVYDATPQQLTVMIDATDRVIRQFRLEAENGRTDEERATARRRARLVEKWSSILIEFQTIRATGWPIDKTDNAYTRWRDKAKRRLPKLPALIAEARAAALVAESAANSCREALGRPVPPPTPATPGVRPGLYATNFGDLTLSVAGDRVSGDYQSGAGKITGTVRDGVLTGVWTQATGLERCATAVDGRNYWGKVEFRFNADGSWTGSWSECERGLMPGWDGKPK